MASQATENAREAFRAKKANAFEDAIPTNEPSVDVNNALDRADAQTARTNEIFNRNAAAVNTAQSVALVAHYDSQADLINATRGVNVTMAPIEQVVSSIGRMALTGATVYNVVEAVKNGDYRSFNAGSYGNSQWGLFQHGQQLIASPLNSWFQTGATSGGWNIGNGGFISNGINNSWNQQEAQNQNGGFGYGRNLNLPQFGGNSGNYNSGWSQQESQNQNGGFGYGRNINLPQLGGQNSTHNTGWSQQENRTQNSFFGKANVPQANQNSAGGNSGWAAQEQTNKQR